MQAVAATRVAGPCRRSCGNSCARWPGARRAGRVAAALLALSLAGCATLPERDALKPASASAPAAQPVQVHDRAGTVTPAAARRVLSAVKAEGDGALAEHHLRVLAASGEVDLYRGNTTRLLLDGPATFAAMKAAIERARSRVLFESYIVEDSAMADELAALLVRKAAQGVAVALMVDALGSRAIDAAYLDWLAASGVALCRFNPVNPLERPGYWSINHRNHRKVLVVDDDVAFTGGINISRAYSTGSAGAGGPDDDTGAMQRGWRDTHIELRGPVVPAFARGFAALWASQGCQGAVPAASSTAEPARAAPGARLARTTPGATPARAAPGQRVVKLLESDPRDPGNRIYSALLQAIDGAQRSVHLTMAYFAPGADMVAALADAARRGVDVSLVLPGRSDFTLVLHAGRSYYDELLDAGVRIHEMDQAVMHAKTAVIDGVFSTVGSSNMDWRSWVANNEVNVIVLGSDFGQELEAVFQRDVAQSRPIDADAWRRRGLPSRVMEQLGRIAERLL